MRKRYCWFYAYYVYLDRSHDADAGKSYGVMGSFVHTTHAFYIIRTRGVGVAGVIMHSVQFNDKNRIT